MKKILRKGYLFRLKPSAEVKAKLANHAEAGRFLWNKIFALNLSRLENKHNLIWYQEMSFWLTLWKKSEEDGFLKEAPSQALQQKLRDLDKALWWSLKNCKSKTCLSLQREQKNLQGRMSKQRQA